MLGDNIWLSLLWAVLCIIVVLGLTYWVTRYLAQRGSLGGFSAVGGRRHLKALEQLSLGREQRLAVVQAGERYLLLGITSHSVTTLAEFTQEEAAALWAEDHLQAEKQAPSFMSALQSVLRQKRGDDSK